MFRHPLEIELFGAVKANDAERALELIFAIFKNLPESERSPKLSAKNEAGQSFLHYALACGADDPFIFDQLFRYYIKSDDVQLFSYNVNRYDVLLSSDNDDCSLLWWATMRGRTDIVGKLLAVYQKKRNELKEASQPLMPARDSWLKPDKNSVTPLHLAASSSNPTLLPLLFSHLENEDDYDDESINQADKKGKTLLHYACKSKRREQIIFLLNIGADFKISAFYTYLERNPSLLSDKTLDINIKRQILSDYRKQIILNPDNKALKQFHKVFSAQAGLQELAREMILLSGASQKDTLASANKSQAKLAATTRDRVVSSRFKIMEVFSELTPIDESAERKERKKLKAQHAAAIRTRDIRALVPTSATTLSTLGISEAELNANKLYQQIAKDKQSLQTYANVILTHIEQIEKDKAEEVKQVIPFSLLSSLPLKRVALMCSGVFSAVAGAYGILAIILFFVFSSLSPALVPVLAVLGVIFIASAPVLVISGYLVVKQNKLIYADTKTLLPEAKELLAKLTQIQDKNVNNLPDDINFIKEFSETINFFESIVEPIVAPIDDKKHAEIIEKLKSLRHLIITISEAMETADKPITPMVEIEEDLPATPAVKPEISTLDTAEVVVEINAAANEANEIDSEAIDRMLQDLPNVSKFSIFYATPRAEDEEATPLLDQTRTRNDETRIEVGI